MLEKLALRMSIECLQAESLAREDFLRVFSLCQLSATDIDDIIGVSPLACTAGAAAALSRADLFSTLPMTGGACTYGDALTSELDHPIRSGWPSITAALVLTTEVTP